MSTIYILIPIAVLITAIGIYLFFWAVKTEQFDDLEKQGMSILFEDDSSDKEYDHEAGLRDYDIFYYNKFISLERSNTRPLGAAMIAMLEMISRMKVTVMKTA